MPHAAAPNTRGDACTSDSTESQRMSSADQAQLDVEINTTVQSSHAQPAKDDSVQGAQAIQQLDLHSGSDGGSTAGECSESDADDVPPPRDHEEPSYGDEGYWDQRYSKELAPGSTAPPHFDWYASLASACTALASGRRSGVAREASSYVPQLCQVWTMRMQVHGLHQLAAEGGAAGAHPSSRACSAGGPCSTFSIVAFTQCGPLWTQSIHVWRDYVLLFWRVGGCRDIPAAA